MQTVKIADNQAIFTVTEAADAIKVKTTTIRAWLRAGILRGYKLPGGDWRILQSDLFTVLTPNAQVGD